MRTIAGQFRSVRCDFERFRQASEQNFTLSQSRCHFFRHVIARPHSTQGLVGRLCGL